MKRQLVVLFIASIMIVAACAPAATPTPTPPTTSSTAQAAIPTKLATAGPTPYAAQSACDYPYLPLRLGATWTYSLPAYLQVNTVIGLDGDSNSATATLSITNTTGANLRYVYVCSPTGLNFDHILGFTTGTTTTTQYKSSAGVLLVGADQFKAGATWRSSSPIEITQGAKIINQFTLSQTYQLSGPESIGVPAGKFEALRVDVAQQSIPANGTASNSKVVNWYTLGVGLVRTIFPDGTPVELISYKVP